MKVNTKSSITLPADELKMVSILKKRMKIKTNVEVIRQGLFLLFQNTEKKLLQDQFTKASMMTRTHMKAELADLDHLTDENLD